MVIRQHQALPLLRSVTLFLFCASRHVLRALAFWSALAFQLQQSPYFPRHSCWSSLGLGVSHLKVTDCQRVCRKSPNLIYAKPHAPRTHSDVQRRTDVLVRYPPGTISVLVQTLFDFGERHQTNVRGPCSDPHGISNIFHRHIRHVRFFSQRAQGATAAGLPLYPRV